jgi:hypothetical protein
MKNWKAVLTIDNISGEINTPFFKFSHGAILNVCIETEPSKILHKQTRSHYERTQDRVRIIAFWNMTPCNLVWKNTISEEIGKINIVRDRLCGLVVWVPGYRSRGQGSIPGATRFSDKKKKRKTSSGSGTGSTQPREYNWGATWKKK